MIALEKYSKTYWMIIGVLTIYAFFKQRKEYGCEGNLFSLEQQCIDEKSVYFQDTQYEKGDDIHKLTDKVLNLLSYHEKAGVWKICIIAANIFTLLIFSFFPYGRNLDFISIHLALFAGLYFYFNFVNYFHFRRMKGAGENLLTKIKEECRSPI